MKKSDRNLLLAAGAAGVVALVALKKKDGTTVSGIPGVGAVLPTSSWVPEKWRGQPTPLWLDAAFWGGVGLLAAPYLGMKKLL